MEGAICRIEERANERGCLEKRIEGESKRKKRGCVSFMVGKIVND